MHLDREVQKYGPVDLLAPTELTFLYLHDVSSSWVMPTVKTQDKPTT